MFTPERAGVGRVERVLGVDERGDAALGLGFGDHVQADGGLARALGPEDLHDAAPGDAADAERDVERQRAGRDDGDPGPGGVLAELHDGAFAELLLDLLERDVEHLVAIHPGLLLPGPSPRPTGEEVPCELVCAWTAHATGRL